MSQLDFDALVKKININNVTSSDPTKMFIHIQEVIFLLLVT